MMSHCDVKISRVRRGAAYSPPPSLPKPAPEPLRPSVVATHFEIRCRLDGRVTPLNERCDLLSEAREAAASKCRSLGYAQFHDLEPAEHVAALIRKALEYIPKEQLVISTDCGFGREGLSRRIAFYKCVALVEGTNIVRRELGLPEARVRAADPKLWFAGRELASKGS